MVQNISQLTGALSGITVQNSFQHHLSCQAILQVLQFVGDLKYKKRVMRHFYQCFYLYLQLTRYRYSVVYRLQARDMFVNSNWKNYFKKRGEGGVGLFIKTSIF